MQQNYTCIICRTNKSTFYCSERSCALCVCDPCSQKQIVFVPNQNQNQQNNTNSQMSGNSEPNINLNNNSNNPQQQVIRNTGQTNNSNLNTNMNLNTNVNVNVNTKQQNNFQHAEIKDLENLLSKLRSDEKSTPNNVQTHQSDSQSSQLIKNTVTGMK